MNALPRSTPESVGIPSSAIAAFVDRIEEKALGLHSFMILRHGKVAAEGWWHPYRAEDIHLLYSLSKSFASTAIGFAIAEGLLDLDDQVISFFPEETPPNPSPELTALKVRHLLSMSMGQIEVNTIDLPEENSWIHGILRRKFSLEPGTGFQYNNAATYSLSAILHRLTGQNLTEYLRPRLFDPIGIGEADWQQNLEGIDLGASGLSLTTESVARFGQLYLQDGMWNGQRVLPEGWVKEATRVHIATPDHGDGDWGQGYGFQFWRCLHNGFRGDGAFGQNCIVMPDQDLVVVTTSGSDDLQGILETVWETILPALTENEISETVTSEKKSLTLPQPLGQLSSPIAELGSRLGFKGDEGSFSIERVDDCLYLTVNGEEIVAGLGEWKRFESAFDSPKRIGLAASAAWPNPNELTVFMCQTGSPTGYELTAKFSENNVAISVSRPHTFLPPEGPTFTATCID